MDKPILPGRPAAPWPSVMNDPGPRTCFEITAMKSDAIGSPGMYSASAQVRLLRDLFLQTKGTLIALSYPKVQKSQIRELIREQAGDQLSDDDVEGLADIVDAMERVLSYGRSGPRQDIKGVGPFEVIWMVMVASYLSYLIGDYEELS